MIQCIYVQSLDYSSKPIVYYRLIKQQEREQTAGGLGDSPEGDEGRKGSSLEWEGGEMTDEEKGTEG